MLEKNKKHASSTAVERVKRRSMLKKQRIAIFVVLALIILLIAAIFAANYFIGIYDFADVDGTGYHIKKVNGKYALCYKSGEMLDVGEEGYYITDFGTEVQIDASTGAASIVNKVDVNGSEELEKGQNLLMFKRLTYDSGKTNDASRLIKSIEVYVDSSNSYTFERESGNLFKIKGHENTPFIEYNFAQLATSCGYTVCAVRLESPKLLEDGSIDYAEYGLAPKAWVETETDEEGNEVEVTHNSEPSWFVVTTMSDEVHKVYIGDLTPTETGYYAKYEGRDTIYVLSSAGFSNYVLQGIEKFVTPMIAFPTEQNTYFDVRDFIIYDKIDHDGIVADLEEMFGSDDSENEEIGDEDFDKIYSELLEKNSHKICHLSYQNTIVRKGTLFAYTPYVSKLEYAGGYRINSETVDNALYALYDTEFTEVIKLSPSVEDLEAYGLYEAPYMMLYYYSTTNGEGEAVLVENQISVSAKNEDGIFYAYSPFYDMIVGVSESSFGFLEYDEISWYETNYVHMDIAHVEEIAIQSAAISVNFRIDDSVSKYTSFNPQSGSNLKEGEKNYKISKNDGKYTLVSDDATVSSVYQGDFLVTPIQCTPGVNEGDGYMFFETSKIDANGDGNDDAVMLYIYNIYGTRGNYRLAQIERMADMDGNIIGEDKVVWLDPQKTTDFFTKSNYVYLTSKNSYIGRELDNAYVNEAKYGNNPRGAWGSGSIYSTAINGQTILVDSETGSWCYLSGTSCGIFFAGKDTSRLSGRALKIPEIKEGGKYKQYAETYYPTTGNDLELDANGEIIVIDSKTRERRAATYEDCTIGVWCKGAYYATEGGNLIAVMEDTGDWGIVNLVSSETYVADVFADNERLDYVIKTTNHVGKLVQSTAMDNFKQFYGSLLYASFDGMAELSEEEKAELRLHDDFATGENNCQLKITIKASDMYGNRRDLVYRIYQYTERKSYITVEVISPDDGYASSSEGAYGNFFVLRSFADKIIEDAKRMVNEQEIDSAAKY